MNQKTISPVKTLLFTRMEWLYLFLLCLLPWAAILFFLKHSFVSTALSLIVVVAINVIYIYLFQLHMAMRICAVLLKSLETLFSFLVLKTQGPFDIFLVLGNMETVPKLISSSGVLDRIIFFGLIILVCVIQFFLFRAIKTRFQHPVLLILPVIFIVLQKPFVNYPVISKVIRGDYNVKTDIGNYPTIAKDQKLIFQKDSDVIYLQLEGLNSKVVNGDVIITGKHYDKPAAPVFLKYAQRGYYFPEFYTAAPLTTRSQEVILCGVADNLGDYYAKRRGQISFKCLPEIFKENGYKTYFFRSDDLRFPNTGNFMKKIGFDVVVNREIMKEGDKEYSWGYADDIFYQRVFEFLSREKSKKKFIYIEVSALNHYPYDNFEELRNLRVYANPKNFYERFANTTRQQDEMLRTFFRYFDQYAKKNTRLAVMGDHSIPVGINHTLNFAGGIYDDIFLTSMFYVSPDIVKPQTITNRYSHLNFFHTILELFAKDYQTPFSIPEIVSNPLNQNAPYIRLNQPYGDSKKMAIVHYPDKWTYDFYSQNISYTNLSDDRFEQKESVIAERWEKIPLDEIIATRQTRRKVTQPGGEETASQNLANQPQTVQDYVRRGVRYGNKGQANLAIEEFEKALEIEPDNASLYVLLGTAYMNLTAWDMALTKFQKAIEIDPGPKIRPLI